MRAIKHHITENPLSILVIALPLAFLAEISYWGAIWLFALSAICVIPMARYIGSATESFILGIAFFLLPTI